MPYLIELGLIEFVQIDDVRKLLGDMVVVADKDQRISLFLSFLKE